MAIKTFEDWYQEKLSHEYDPNEAVDATISTAYKAGVKEASDHFEEEKIKIHEYYALKLAELFDHEPPKGSDKNNGRLT